MDFHRRGRWLSWLGFGLVLAGRLGLAAWAGLGAGWLVLAWIQPSGGWLTALLLTYAAALALPSLVALQAGHYVARRGSWSVPPTVVRVGWRLVAAAFVLAGLLAYLSGWPR